MPLTIGLQRLHLLALFLAVVSCDPIPASANDPNVIERFKVERDGDGLLIPVTVSGNEYLFLLDTGATITMIDSSLLADIPFDNTSAETPAGRMPISKHCVPHASFGQQQIEGSIPYVLGLDFAELRETSGHPIYGVIGMDILRQWVLQIDFDRGALELSKQARDVEGSQAVGIEYGKDRLPRVRASIGGTEAIDFVIDTASISYETGNLDSRFIGAQSKSAGLRNVGSHLATTAAGIRSSNLLQAKSLRVGQIETLEPIFAESKGNSLGLYWLSRFSVTLDFPNSTMFLREGKSHDKSDLINRTGLHILKRDGRVLIAQIEPASAAAQSDLRVGDQIVRINELVPQSSRLDELRRCLCDGDKATIVVTRDGKEFEATLKLE
jgi:hypothetical protein